VRVITQPDCPRGRGQEIRCCEGVAVEARVGWAEAGEGEGDGGGGDPAEISAGLRCDYCVRADYSARVCHSEIGLDHFARSC